MKDLAFSSLYHTHDTSIFTVKYGEKEIVRVALHNDDISEAKVIALAVQGEIMKDIINKNPTTP